MRGEVSFLGKHLKDTSGLRPEPQSVKTQALTLPLSSVSVFVAKILSDQFCCAETWMGSRAGHSSSRLEGMKWKKKHKEMKERNQRPQPHREPDPQDA